MEKWKTITTHTNYEVSSLGRVRNKTTNEFKHSTPNPQGYVNLTLYSNGVGKTFVVHRLVAEYFIPNPDNKPLVNHIDACRHNNFTENLEWCTQSENMKHMVNIGNNKDHNGHNNPAAKLTEEQVKVIRNDDRPGSVLAALYDVSTNVIDNVKNGNSYKNVAGTIRAKGYKGNQVRGEKSGTSRITDAQAYEIKYGHKDLTQEAIGKLYGVSKNVTQRIRSGKSWTHI